MRGVGWGGGGVLWGVEAGLVGVGLGWGQFVLLSSPLLVLLGGEEVGAGPCGVGRVGQRFEWWWWLK